MMLLIIYQTAMLLFLCVCCEGVCLPAVFPHWFIAVYKSFHHVWVMVDYSLKGTFFHFSISQSTPHTHTHTHTHTLSRLFCEWVVLSCVLGASALSSPFPAVWNLPDMQLVWKGPPPLPYLFFIFSWLNQSLALWPDPTWLSTFPSFNFLTSAVVRAGLRIPTFSFPPRIEVGVVAKYTI